MKSKILIILIAGLLAGPMAANAVPVFTNASFETGDDYGWTVANPFLGVQDWNNSVTGGLFGAQDGTYATLFGAFENGGSSYGQIVDGFNVGASYTVTFGMVPEHGSTRDRTRTVATTLLSLVGADVDSQSFAAEECVTPNNSASSCLPEWQDMSLTFTALSSFIDFTWTADLVSSPRSWEFGFDNVRLRENIPEPSILALLGLGLLGIGAARRKKHND